MKPIRLILPITLSGVLDIKILKKMLCLFGIHKWKSINNVVECCFRCYVMRVKTPKDYLNWHYKIEANHKKLHD